MACPVCGKPSSPRSKGGYCSNRCALIARNKSPEQRQAIRDKWKDPEFRAKQSEQRKEKWANNPERHEAQSKLFSETLKECYKDPEYKERHSKRSSEMWEQEGFRENFSEKWHETWKEKLESDEYKKFHDYLISSLDLVKTRPEIPNWFHVSCRTTMFNMAVRYDINEIMQLYFFDWDENFVKIGICRKNRLEMERPSRQGYALY